MTAPRYLQALYKPEERLALVALPRFSAPDGAPQPKVEQRLWPCSKAASPPVQAWLRHANAAKYDIFVGMNPLRAGSRGRHKEDVLRVDRIYLDIDRGGDKALERILADAARGDVGQPRFAIRTSPGRCQVIWQLEPRGALEKPRAEALMRGLVEAYGADKAAVDVSRVLRVPGFRNHKRDGCRVEVTWESPARVPPEAFREPLYKRGEELGRLVAPVGSYTPPAGGGGHDTSRSGADWRWVKSELKRGANPATLEQTLAARRTDKANPSYYARRTIARARQSMDLSR